MSRAYDAIRAMTVGFAVAPDARLNEVQLAAELGMSRAPVREALNRLVADGLVAFEPRRGFRCRRLSVSEVADLYAVRADLERGAVREAARRGATNEALALRARWRTVLDERDDRSADDLVAADEAFHADLVALAGNDERGRYLANVGDRIRFVRRINLDDPDRRRASLAEHAPILDAVIAGDGEGAASLLDRHLRMSTDEVRRHVEAGLARIYARDVA